MSRRWKIALIVSLALNLFLAGALAARLAWRWEQPRRGGHMEPAGGPGLSALTPERRDAFRVVVRRAAENNRPAMREVREARRSAARRFAAEPYDAAAVAAELRRASALEMRLRERMEVDILTYGGELSVAERAAVAPLLERGLRRVARGERRRDRRE